MTKLSAFPDAEGFLQRLNAESPRSRIMLEAGFIEELLRAAVRARLANNSTSDELFGKSSTLGLVVLAKYAHALGLIGKQELNCLKKFAKARNLIAHSWKADFTQKEMQEISESMQFVSVEGEKNVDAHQRCFGRLDYVGIYLTEEFQNRFAKMPGPLYNDAIAMTKLRVDPVTGLRSWEAGPDK